MCPCRLAAAIACLVLLAGAAPARGHAVLTRSSVDGATVRADTPMTVTLRFNSAIERGLAKVVLVNDRREERPLEIVPAGERGEVKVAVPGLPPGAYGLRYKVLAADGHTTESILRFRVSAAE